METFNEKWFSCSPDRAFELARRVEKWPRLLPHYRWVRFLYGGPETGGVVEMAARRDFGPLGWPVWWQSEMEVLPEERVVRYRHVRGITRGMAVEWRIVPQMGGSRVTIVHRWDGGPAFCGPAAPWAGKAVVGPVFIHHVADQTLTYLAQSIRKERGA